MNYQIIYADPPWTYRDKCHSGERGAGYKYNLMTLEQIMALPIQTLAAPDCLLAMWWVPPMPLEAMKVVQAWGFTLKTMKLFTWHKVTKNGKDHFGMGNWSRANSEDCLIATRGKPQRVSRAVRQMIHSPIREHSRKPDEARDRLVELMGDVPRVELFARQKVNGWDVWGLDVSPDLVLVDPAQPAGGLVTAEGSQSALSSTGALGSVSLLPTSEAARAPHPEDSGKRYEVHCRNKDGSDMICGWQDSPSGYLMDSFEKHSPYVIDRGPK